MLRLGKEASLTIFCTLKHLGSQGTAPRIPGAHHGTLLISALYVSSESPRSLPASNFPMNFPVNRVLAGENWSDKLIYPKIHIYNILLGVNL